MCGTVSTTMDISGCLCRRSAATSSAYLMFAMLSSCSSDISVSTWTIYDAPLLRSLAHVVIFSSGDIGAHHFT